MCNFRWDLVYLCIPTCSAVFIQPRGKWKACVDTIREEPWHLETTLASAWTKWFGMSFFLWYFFRLIELILHRLSYLQYHWLFLLLFQIVMVVDARDPLFYRCPDLEVTLSLPTCWYLLIELSWSISTINVKICSETGICTRNWWA